MTRLHGSKNKTLQLMQAARLTNAKVVVLEPPAACPAVEKRGPARILPFTKSRCGG